VGVFFGANKMYQLGQRHFGGKSGVFQLDYKPLAAKKSILSSHNHYGLYTLRLGEKTTAIQKGCLCQVSCDEIIKKMPKPFQHQKQFLKRVPSCKKGESLQVSLGNENCLNLRVDLRMLLNISSS